MFGKVFQTPLICTPMASWCRSDVFIVNFEHVIVGWKTLYLNYRILRNSQIIFMINMPTCDLYKTNLYQAENNC